MQISALQAQFHSMATSLTVESAQLDMLQTVTVLLSVWNVLQGRPLRQKVPCRVFLVSFLSFSNLYYTHIIISLSFFLNIHFFVKLFISFIIGILLLVSVFKFIFDCQIICLFLKFLFC